MLIPFHKMNLKIGLADLLIIEGIIKSGQVVSGEWTEQLELAFKKLTGVRYAIACANCTSGLQIAIKAAGWQDARLNVALPSFTWPSTEYAIDCADRCMPVYTDVDKKTWCVTEIPKQADAAIVVDTFGNQAHVETNKSVIYDAAHGYGLPKLGQRGIAEVVSLAMTKAVTGMQGGIILTNNWALATRARYMVKQYAKITEINAYIALNSMKEFDKDLERRFKAVEMYCDCLRDPYEIQEIPVKTNLSVFAILLPSVYKRNRVAEAFKKLDIEVKIYYKPLKTGFENTDEIHSRIIALPTWGGIEGQITAICRAINNA